MSVVIISGGTGLIGQALTGHLVERGYDIVILTRQKDKKSGNLKVRYSCWNVEQQIIDTKIFHEADHIIHLSGAGVMEHKWTEGYKRQILQSRTRSAELIVKCLKENANHVKTFVSASAIGYYGEDAKNDDLKDGFNETDLPANDFLGETCLLWEACVEPVTTLGIRLVKLRTGMVLSKSGGAVKEFKKPLRFGIAPVFGSGKQIVSWIHIDDLCRMYCEAIENNYVSGSYNAVAPEPVSQKKLILVLANKMRHKFFTAIHIPVFILKFILGTRSIEILKSAMVNDRKIKSAGFTFLYPSIEAAVDKLD